MSVYQEGEQYDRNAGRQSRLPVGWQSALRFRAFLAGSNYTGDQIHSSPVDLLIFSYLHCRALAVA